MSEETKLKPCPFCGGRAILDACLTDAVDLFRDNGLGDFISTKYGICKDEILAEYAKERLTDVDLYKGGVEVIQGERFFVRVSKTESDKK